MCENEPSNPINEQLISWVKVLMICSGLWEGPVGVRRIVKNLYNVYSRFMKFSFFFFCFSLTLEFLRLAIGGYDTDIVFMKYQLAELFNEIIKKEQQVWASGSEEIQALYRSKVKFVKGTVLTLFLPSLVTVFMLQVVGGLATLKIRQYNSINNASLESHLMYQAIFPLNRINHLNWLFLSEILWGWTGLTYASVTHLIYITILVYAATQLQILQIRFRNLMGSEEELSPTQGEVLEGARKLREHIITHKIIIRFLVQFNNTTKHIIMVDFLCYSLDIASVLSSITKMRITEAGFFIFYFLTLFVQLVMTAWSCNEVTVQSEALGDALFQSKWYLLDQQSQRNVLFILKRIRKPLHMTIGIFGPMTTNTIVLVLKAAYSYVNLILTLASVAVLAKLIFR
ncbi:odorant receptor 43a-like [Euwallacea similis]|uniref:odorant receptor 43a-like n=1 Tax=Euwallacea similis TaxID=1736056 RepID=UPI0034508006